MKPSPHPRNGKPRLVLASASPRRRALLAMAGFEFDVVPPEVEETFAAGEPPEDVVARLAAEKAAAVRGGVPAGSRVLACDTVVVLDDEVLGKPSSADEAVGMLLRLAGRTHRVLTGFVVVSTGPAGSAAGEADRTDGGIAESLVTIARVTAAEASAYATGGEPLDKAGAYALQGEGKRFVERVEGSRSNVVGLPLELLVPALARSGVHRRNAEVGLGGTP